VTHAHTDPLNPFGKHPTIMKKSIGKEFE